MYEKVIFVIVKFHNNNFGNKVKSYNLTLMGKKIINYVRCAASDYNTYEINTRPNGNLVAALQPYAKKCKHLGVLYCDTPLLTKKTVNDAVDYAILKNLDVCRLPKGYIFKSDFLKNYNPTTPIAEFNHYEEEFHSVSNFYELNKISSIMQSKINANWQLKGVNIVNSGTVYIEPDVNIEQNVIILNNNHIFGNSIIKNGATLKENNKIFNCYIGKNVVLQNNTISNLKITNYKQQ